MNVPSAANTASFDLLSAVVKKLLLLLNSFEL